MCSLLFFFCYPLLPSFSFSLSFHSIHSSLNSIQVPRCNRTHFLRDVKYDRLRVYTYRANAFIIGLECASVRKIVISISARVASRRIFPSFLAGNLCGEKYGREGKKRQLCFFFFFFGNKVRNKFVFD